MLRLILILGVLAAMAIAGFLGYAYWDLGMGSLLAVLAWGKKLMTLGGLLGLLRSVPLLLLAGLKKLVIKLLSSILLLAVTTRFRPVRAILIRVKFFSRRMLRRLRGHWTHLPTLDRSLLLILLLPSSVLLVGLLVAFAVPKALQIPSLRRLVASKIESTSGAGMIQRLVPAKVRSHAENLHGRAHQAVKDRLTPGEEIKETPVTQDTRS